ncbi:MAG: indole-3-glycerol phosphate synthase TrpC [Alphaproteobacteria bacterium]|nr:indole-3-glycerol phosphate synthase TrpC [Alphaproteobacteria bacterium]
MTILDDIAEYKRREIAAAKARVPEGQLDQDAWAMPAPRGFRAALMRARSENRVGLIAEIKKASPSRGLIRVDFDPAALARAYAAGGATCLSVLTDAPSFQGAPEFLAAAHAATTLPVLRKDFMLDPYQVTETRAWGADCILIIMALTDDAQSRELFAIARNYHGMDVLVEVHNEGELDRALALGADIIGINNRDLKTFSIDLGVTLRLAPRIPADKLVVAESGLARREDLALLAKAGVTTFLIGEGLMRHKDVAAATSALIGAKLNP